MDWIGVAQDKDMWRALVNAAMNLWIVRFEVFTAVTMKNISSQRASVASAS
jgi:hypothetical protein